MIELTVPLGQLTAARRRALTVLAYGRDHGLPVFESNHTTEPLFLDRDGVRLCIYWQTRAWLSKNELIVRRGHRHHSAADRWELTDDGSDLVARAGIEWGGR